MKSKLEEARESVNIMMTDKINGIKGNIQKDWLQKIQNEYEKVIDMLKCCDNCYYKYDQIYCSYPKTGKICNKKSGWEIINN